MRRVKYIYNILKGGLLILNHDDKYFNYLSKKAKLMKLKVFFWIK